MHPLPARPSAQPCRFTATAVAVLAAALLGTAPAGAQMSYPSAEAASQAFVDAVRGSDNEALHRVLGADWKRVVQADTIARSDIEAFLTAWQHGHKIEPQADGSARLSVGPQGWTLPIPLVATASGWRFDPRRGADELRTRRIGRNELAAMQAALAYLDAQREYAIKDRDGNGVHEYAQKLRSAAGRHDGLYWPDAPGQDRSPLGPWFARAQPKQSAGYHGYFYKILSSQGSHAPGGAYDYLIGGRMRAGFALLAWPVRYGDSGVMSFMVSHDGVLFEKDLGPGTSTAARTMSRFDPDASWTRVAVPERP
ncbi:DUF2950 domain-containing protein [Aquabacterium sp. A7-Y]|uniref:DUF2950 domain-containing protein n=1 Tax=Aquabacterium sp. A7-Y TaxID=1349605 RepID=UPI00223D9818|nr:DUF2950 domain-containing protein [Aquabacterium sp. A7-Y]MCW7538557.1 DUF2950 domain-containing protein [Aquabacterium sp. A7-Y]